MTKNEETKLAVSGPTRMMNLLRESHRTARVTPLFYVPVFMLTTMLLLPFLAVEPESFDYADHV